MKKLIHNLEIIKPDLLPQNGQVEAWFTLKNIQNSSDEGSIPGFNLSYNTKESEEIVSQNRLELIKALGLEQEWIAYADQVHSNKIQVVTQGGTFSNTDGLVTKVPGLTLAIQVADCAAVLLWDESNKIIAASHAGWRGAVGDIVPLTLEKMCELGADIQQIKAYVSPCISKANFEVGPEVADLFPGEFVDYDNYPKPHVNLKGFLRRQMLESGMEKQHIEVDEGCTMDDEKSYYSFRREGDRSGRMMGLIQLKH